MSDLGVGPVGRAPRADRWPTCGRIIPGPRLPEDRPEGPPGKALSRPAVRREPTSWPHQRGWGASLSNADALVFLAMVVELMAGTGLCVYVLFEECSAGVRRSPEARKQRHIDSTDRPDPSDGQPAGVPVGGAHLKGAGEKTAADQHPHLLHAHVDDQEHGLSWEVDCPYGGPGPRPYLLLEEASDCPWAETGECALMDSGLAGETDLFGHDHHAGGCAVRQYLHATGMGEAVVWHRDGFELVLPQPFIVAFIEEGAVVIGPVDTDYCRPADGAERRQEVG